MHQYKADNLLNILFQILAHMMHTHMYYEFAYNADNDELSCLKHKGNGNNQRIAIP